VVSSRKKKNGGEKAFLQKGNKKKKLTRRTRTKRTSGTKIAVKGAVRMMGEIKELKSFQKKKKKKKKKTSRGGTYNATEQRQLIYSNDGTD